MRYVKTNTATVITVGPFLDKTDGITPETALTVTNCHLTLMVDNAGSPTLALDAAATASGGNNDMVHITNDDAGMYSLELTAAQLNYLGGAILAITDAANHCPVFHELNILPALVYDSLIGGSDNLQVDAIQILGTAISAPATAGILDVNLKNIANAAVSTSAAQLGVNAVQIGGATPANTTIGTVTAVTTVNGLAANTITAAVIATDAIDGDAIAASAVTKIQNGLALTADLSTDAEIADAVWNEARSGHTTAGSFGEGAASVQGNIAGSIGSLATQAKADVNAEVVDVLRTDTIPDSVAADGSQPTVAQALYMIWQFLSEKDSGGTTTVTVFKPDGSTELMHFSIDSATAPTSITRSEP